MERFDYQGHQIAYRTWGEGDRVLVLIHGLLMNSRMFDWLGSSMAKRGYRVVGVDLLGHGESDKPDDLNLYSMTAFGHQVAALLDHLGLEQAVVGGTSLGANVGLEFGVAHPERAAGLFIEMPVLDNALAAVAVAFTPVIVATEFGAPVLRGVASLARRIPRRNHLVDIGLDWIRRDPDTSAHVLQGLLLGRTCPPSYERETIEAPALVVGHPRDPVHPFSDSDQLIAEMPNARLVDANSIIEWRVTPGRLNAELAGFLEQVHGSSKSGRVRAAA